MQVVRQDLLDLAAEKYQYSIIVHPKAPTLRKIVDADGRMVVENYFTSMTIAELRLCDIVEKKEAAEKKKLNK